MPFGAYTSGWTEHPWGEMRIMALGFAVPTSIKRVEMAFERTSRQTVFGVWALLFVASTAVTIVWGASMGTMGGMPMPGGWTMSMTWMPGQDWSGATLSFLGMWVVMMIAMMMPSLVPMLLH